MSAGPAALKKRAAFRPRPGERESCTSLVFSCHSCFRIFRKRPIFQVFEQVLS